MFVYANILKQTWGPLYCYLFDKANGSGKVGSIFVEDIAKELNKSKRTINRLLKDNPAFREVIRHKTGKKSTGYITVYLKSWRKIRDELKLDLGPRFECDKDCLLENKYYSVLAHALSIQARSFYACKRKIKKDKEAKIQALRNQRIKNKNKTSDQIKTEIELETTEYTPYTVSPLKFFTNINGNSKGDLSSIRSSPKVQGQIFRSDKSSITKFFMCSSFRTFGASNETIAKESDFSIRRVIDLLNKAIKVNIYHFSPNYYGEREEAIYLDEEERSNTSNRYYQYKNMMYKSMPNIYYPLLHLCGGNNGNTNRKYESTPSKIAFTSSSVSKRRQKNNKK